MLNESEVQEQRVGTHIAYFEPPNLFVVRIIGDYSASDILSHAEFYKLAAGKFYLLVDTSAMGAFTSEAKKAIKDVPTASAVAIFGTSRQAKLLLSLLTKVYVMVSMGKTAIQFVSNEAEGREWLDKQRKSAS